MSQCTVYVYDDTLTAVSSSFIEIRECDPLGLKLDIQPGATLGPGEFGAKITLPNPPEPIVIWVDDTSSHYAPTSLAFLNGKETARLDITLYALPPLPGGGGGGGGGGPRGRAVVQPPCGFNDYYSPAQTVDAISRHINQRVSSGAWSDSEALGVKSLVDTTVRALHISEPDKEMQEKLSRWGEQLKRLGITIMAEVQFTIAPQPRTVTAE